MDRAENNFSPAPRLRCAEPLNIGASTQTRFNSPDRPSRHLGELTPRTPPAENAATSARGAPAERRRCVLGPCTGADPMRGPFAGVPGAFVARVARRALTMLGDVQGLREPAGPVE